MEKVVYVKAHFRPIGKTVKVKVPTGETKKGFFGGTKNITRTEEQWEDTGYSDCFVDGERLAQDLQEVINNLNKDGYSVLQITNVTSGSYDYKYQAQGVTSSPRILSDGEAVSGGASFGYGYGFSFTESLIVIAKK